MVDATPKTALDAYKSYGEQLNLATDNVLRNGGEILEVSADITLDAWGSDGATEYAMFLNVDESGGAVTITLPAATTTEAGRQVVVRQKTGSANNTTIDVDASGTINGASSVSITAQYQRQRLFCDGAEWCLW